MNAKKESMKKLKDYMEGVFDSIKADGEMPADYSLKVAQYAENAIDGGNDRMEVAKILFEEIQKEIDIGEKWKVKL